MDYAQRPHMASSQSGFRQYSGLCNAGLHHKTRNTTFFSHDHFKTCLKTCFFWALLLHFINTFCKFNLTCLTKGIHSLLCRLNGISHLFEKMHNVSYQTFNGCIHFFLFFIFAFEKKSVFHLQQWNKDFIYRHIPLLYFRGWFKCKGKYIWHLGRLLFVSMEMLTKSSKIK